MCCSDYICYYCKYLGRRDIWSYHRLTGRLVQSNLDLFQKNCSDQDEQEKCSLWFQKYQREEVFAGLLQH